MDDVTDELEPVEQVDAACEGSSDLEQRAPVAVVYARTAHCGDPSSCERQMVAAKAYAAAHGLELGATYHDEGCSGLTIAGRVGLELLLADARQGAFEVLITEPDQLSRSASNLLSVWEDLASLGVAVHAPGRGRLTSFDAVVAADLGNAEADRERFAAMCDAGRRQAATHGRLLSPVFGYRRDLNRRGDYIVDPDKAEVVRHIFGRLAEGASAAAIARDLSAAGVPVKTASRVRAIARCPTYSGVIVWGRTTSTRDPATGARVVRLLPRDRWVVTRRDDLAIVSSELWARAAARLNARSRR